MPRGDRSGPDGMGPMTGRGAGFCSGFSAPGFTNASMPRLGLGRGRGRSWHRFNPGPAYYNMPTAAPYSPEGEAENLQQSAKMLQNQLDQIQQRLAELKKDTK